MSFDINYLKKPLEFKEREKYCLSNLRELSCGSSRRVFNIDGKSVLKLSINEAGNDQNKFEYETSNKNYPILAKVHNAETRFYHWIEMEYCKEAKKEDFKRLINTSFDEFTDFIMDLGELLEDGIPDNPDEFIKNTSEKDFEMLYCFDKSIYYKNLYVYLIKEKPLVSDYLTIDNWGIATRKGKEIPVLIDYGLSEDIFNKYY